MGTTMEATTTRKVPTGKNQSQAVRAGHLIYISGQAGCDPETGELAEGLDAQTGA